MAFLKQNDSVGKYRVQNLIKSNHYTETYRVEDADQNAYFLKLFVMNRIPQKLVNPETRCVYEIEYCKRIAHRNIISFVSEGTLEKEEGVFQYYVTDYFQGQLLADRLQVGGPMPEAEAVEVFRQILTGLQFLHTQTPALCHNDLDPSNIVLRENTSKEAVLIDLGHLSKPCSGAVWFDTADLNLLYHAKETMVGIFDQQGDIFSACCVLYAMLTGKAPWNGAQLPAEGAYKDRFKELWQYRKQHALDFSSLTISDKLKFVMSIGLAEKASDRFASAEEILHVLDADNPLPQQGEKEEQPSRRRQDHSDEASDPNDLNKIDIEIKRGGGNGFKEIAGMQELKDYVYKHVIFPIKEKELVEQYRITPPNGMLLYGPPGCGKTFFAEKFAEETGFNFMLVKASDLGSSYLHGTQEKVKKLFKKAEKNAPIVLCFDEFDALVPDRSGRGNEQVSSEVNEYLSQMNNCSKRGIFIIATSNRPDKIDPAVMRTGRIDKRVFVPMPDYEARKEMFRMYLENRPVEGIDLEKYAKATEGYIASDIAYIVNDAAMTAAFAKKPISGELMDITIGNIKPSLSKTVIESYGRMQNMMSGEERNGGERKRIGFAEYD